MVLQSHNLILEYRKLSRFADLHSYIAVLQNYYAIDAYTYIRKTKIQKHKLLVHATLF
jgi:hypothetical protein